ncbi:MAG TPA: pyridoxamine 5'-phosphate oxidase family protein [Capsulimonadaceae bacterium]|jgi:hypothetical protein
MAHLPGKVVSLFEGGHIIWVATAAADGTPNIAVKGSGFASDSEHIFFADLFSNKTRANLEQNPIVAIGIYDANIAVQVKGRATMSASGPLYDRVLAAIRAKAPAVPAPKYVVEVAVESVFDMTAGPNAGVKLA